MFGKLRLNIHKFGQSRPWWRVDTCDPAKYFCYARACYQAEVLFPALRSFVPPHRLPFSVGGDYRVVFILMATVRVLPYPYNHLSAPVRQKIGWESQFCRIYRFSMNHMRRFQWLSSASIGSGLAQLPDEPTRNLPVFDSKVQAVSKHQVTWLHGTFRTL